MKVKLYIHATTYNGESEIYNNYANNNTVHPLFIAHIN